jgi:hypothetical protein
MKKTIILILITIVFSSCVTTKQNSYPDYFLGINENPTRKIISMDSLNIVTPGIEIYNRVNKVSHRKYDDREIIKQFVIESLKSELNKTDHYNLTLMSKDYLTINKVLERITYQKYLNPEWIVKAPNEILIEEKKYTLLITMTARYGDINNGVIYFCIINNDDKIIEFVDRYRFNGSPLDNYQTKMLIKIALKKIINT